ncbi:galactokinase [Eudoraea chungangensis]|uniref:galactokinase n=1 Tax=Eudoraea chungangensis TaxID=1481905 RepID=UPI0023EB9075|nr:galactokinase [Eudoraea chungangensis]
MNPFELKSPDIVITSPGRINLIGEHIDYNGGEVLPAAIDLKLKLSFKRTDTEEAFIFSKDLKESFKLNLNKLQKGDIEWHNFFIGVVYYIQKKFPDTIKGFTCVVESDIPFGAGVSSSAALECGIAKGLDKLFNIGLSDSEIITFSRDAEHNFVGTKCGIMDQFAVVKGRKNSLIQLDCATLNYKYVPAFFDPYCIVLLNSNVEHNLASSEYNKRRQSCEEGLKIIKEKNPEFNYLAHVPLLIVQEMKPQFSLSTYQKLVYVIEENERTKAAAKALEDKDLNRFGSLLFASHQGLKSKYEVSCKELDFLVDYASSYEGVLGARMMGGGFGGCTINLVHKDKVVDYIHKIGKAYAEAFHITLTPHMVAIDDGVKWIRNEK